MTSLYNRLLHGRILTTFLKSHYVKGKLKIILIDTYKNTINI